MDVMNIYLVVAFSALVPIGLLFLLLYRTLSSRQSRDIAFGQYSEVPPNKYRPMERLLREEDFRFLAGQPGFSPKVGRRFRAERRRIFRGYLRHLRTDFRGMSQTVQALMVHASDDRRDLAIAVIRLRLLFAVGMLAIETRLLLHTVGVGTVDVSGLVESFETMQAQIRLLLATPQAAVSAI